MVYWFKILVLDCVGFFVMAMACFFVSRTRPRADMRPECIVRTRLVSLGFLDKYLLERVK